MNIDLRTGPWDEMRAVYTKLNVDEMTLLMRARRSGRTSRGGTVRIRDDEA
jgi:hypothetical protein